MGALEEALSSAEPQSSELLSLVHSRLLCTRRELKALKPGEMRYPYRCGVPACVRAFQGELVGAVLYVASHERCRPFIFLAFLLLFFIPREGEATRCVLFERVWRVYSSACCSFAQATICVR